MNQSLAGPSGSADVAADRRPPYIARLGLLLPCSVEDVESAYRDRAKHAHPDAGGSVAEFNQLQSDYESALEYAHFHASRRSWLAANVERYAAVGTLIAEIEHRGGAVQTERPAWIAHEIGNDFAQVLDTITGVRFGGPSVGTEDVQWLASHRDELSSLHRLDLSDARIDHRAVKELVALPTLHELNLSGTFAGSRSASLLAAMPALRRVNLADTFVSGWGRFQLRRRRPDLEVLTRRDGDHRPSTSQRVYRWVFRLLVLYVIGLVIATHMPEEPEVIRRVNWPGSDKAAHFSIYGGLTFLLALLITVRSRHRRLRTGLSATAYAGIAIFVATFGAIDEITQPWTGRDRDFWDWMADVSGMATGLIVFSLIQLYRRRGRNPALAQSVTPVPITSKPAQVP